MSSQIDEHEELYQKGLFLKEQKDYSAAIEIFLDLYNKQPDHLGSLLGLTNSYFKVGYLPDALYYCKKAYKYYPYSLDILPNLAIMYSRAFPLDELAEPLFRKIIELDDSNPEFFSEFASALIAMEKYEEAIECYEKALALNPNGDSRSLLLYSLGLTYLYVNKGKAEIIASKLLKINNELAEHIFRLIKQNQLPFDQPEDPISSTKAEKHYDNAVDLLKRNLPQESVNELLNSNREKETSVALTLLGKILDDFRLIDEGICLHRKAIKKDPTYAMAYNNLGYAFQVKGDPKSAIEAYNKALEINPNQIETHNNIGVLYDYLGDYEKGVSHFKSALALEPNRFNTLNNLTYALTALGRLDEALEVAKNMCRIFPNNTSPIISAGNIYSQMGEFINAKKEYFKALKIDIDSLSCHLGLYECYIKLGGEKRIRKTFLRVVSTSPRSSQEAFQLAQFIQHYDKTKSIELWEMYLSMAEGYPVDQADINYAREQLMDLYCKDVNFLPS